MARPIQQLRKVDPPVLMFDFAHSAIRRIICIHSRFYYCNFKHKDNIL